MKSAPVVSEVVHLYDDDEPRARLLLRKATEEDIRQLFGEMLQTVRLDMGKSVAYFARFLGVSKAVYRKYERGAELPTDKIQLKKLFSIAPKLRIHEDDIRAFLNARAPEPVVAEVVSIPVPEDHEEDDDEKGTEPPPAYKTFGEALRALRVEAGFTQAQLGQVLGVSASAVEFWEAGINAPVVENYNMLLDNFPELKNAPAPDSRDIPPPIGNLGGTSPGPGPRTKENNMPPPAPRVSSSPAWAPPSLPQSSSPDRRTDLLDWTRIVLALKAHPQVKDFLAFLAVAQRNGLTLDDVIGLLG